MHSTDLPVIKSFIRFLFQSCSVRRLLPFFVRLSSPHSLPRSPGILFDHGFSRVPAVAGNFVVVAAIHGQFMDAAIAQRVRVIGVNLKP